MTSLAGLFVGLVVVPTTIWIALAIHYHLRWPWLRWFASFVPLVVVGASLAVLPLVPWALAVWFGLLVITIAWWFSLRPRSDRDWAVGMEVLPRAEIVGDTLRVRQFRNFSYEAEDKPIPRYEERTYDLAKLSSLDYFLSHWSGPVMAHTLVSFGFDDGQFLCVSVEARRAALAIVFATVGFVSLVSVDVCLGGRARHRTTADEYPPGSSVHVSPAIASGTFATTASRLRQPGRDAGRPARLVQLSHQQLYDQSFLPRPRERAVVDETRHLPEWLFCAARCIDLVT